MLFKKKKHQSFKSAQRSLRGDTNKGTNRTSKTSIPTTEASSLRAVKVNDYIARGGMGTAGAKGQKEGGPNETGRLTTKKKMFFFFHLSSLGACILET